MRAGRGPSRARACGLVVALAACGSRTGLDVGAVDSDAGPSQPAQGFDAGCPQTPWLLFDRIEEGNAPFRLQIYAMHEDGSGGHLVTLPHSPAYFPSVSPDGTKLLYATALPPDAGGGPGVDSALYAYDFASRSESLVIRTSGLTYSALSPDGRFVAYTSSYSLRVVASDGSNDRALLNGPNDGSGYGHPTFAADSRTVVYGTGGIVGAIGVDGSNNRTLLEAIPGSFQYPNPCFSQDYQRVAVGAFCSRTSPYALRVYAFASLPGASCESGQLLVDVDNGASFNLANDPSWGPEGRIAYASGKDVWIIDATGGAPRSLTATLTADGGRMQAADPVWAPGCADVP